MRPFVLIHFVGSDRGPGTVHPTTEIVEIVDGAVDHGWDLTDEALAVSHQRPDEKGTIVVVHVARTDEDPYDALVEDARTILDESVDLADSDLDVTDPIMASKIALAWHRPDLPVRSTATPTLRRIRAASPIHDGPTDAAWRAEGFIPVIGSAMEPAADTLSARTWQIRNFRPRDAAKWRDAGLTAAEAAQWQRAGFSARVAGAWHNAGARNARAVASGYRLAGATKDQLPSDLDVFRWHLENEMAMAALAGAVPSVAGPVAASLRSERSAMVAA